MALINLQCLYVIIYLLLLNFVCIQPKNGQSTANTNSCYPQGSVACKMWNYTNMDCVNRDLVCIPPLRKATSIIFLDLTQNKVNVISDDEFRMFKKLQHLDLSFNEISALYDGAFTGLDELLILGLYGNPISHIQATVFNSLYKLQYMDLSANNISALHDDVFNGFHDLLTLDLRYNFIFFISDKTFSTLGKLTSLDLHGNYLHTLEGAPFKNLISLQTLHLSWQNITSLSTSSLVGLENLQILYLSFHDGSDNITGTPLTQLLSLQTFYITTTIYDCDNIGKLFTGLHNLQHLDITVGGSCPEIKFCSSYEEKNHHLNASNKCTRAIPLTYLKFHQVSSSTTSLPALQVLNNLTDLTLYLQDDIYTAIEVLNSLDSPLQNLTLYTIDRVINLNSTTFASWGNWKILLQILNLCSSTSTLLVGDAAFEWFTDLKILYLCNEYYGQPTSTLFVNAFKGLRSLNNLQLSNINIPLLVPLNIFRRYNSLTKLNLSHNQLSGNFEVIWEQLCNILSLKKIDLSHNNFDNSEILWSCSPPNLKELIIGDHQLIFVTFLQIYVRLHHTWNHLMLGQPQ
ncbi:uncharacterized protein [Amphiura filiformis]|uniref:uncharacterized protein n=1 Tax=Amphiura filiformis TaxID=82378 RepID=UPI003B21DC8E